MCNTINLLAKRSAAARSSPESLERDRKCGMKRKPFRMRFMGGAAKRLRLCGCLLALVCILLFPAWSAAAPTIAGRVTNATSGFGMAGIDLDVFDSSGGAVVVTGATTDLQGDYVIALPTAGTFTIRADPTANDGFADQYYDGVFLPSQATGITVGANDAITGVDFALATGFEIRGQITAGGVGVDGVDIDLFAQTGEFLSGYPAATTGGGLYALGALRPGTYFVRADADPALGQFYVDTFYGNHALLADATPITIVGASVAGTDIALPPGGTIAGRVVDGPSSAPLAGIDLDLFDVAGNRLAVNAVTDATGFYEIGAVSAGQYVLRADPTIAQGYPRTYYEGAYNDTFAQTIAVVAGARTTNVDFALPRGGAISGTVREAGTGTLLENIDLDCFDALGRRVDVTARTDANGQYQLGALAPGDYFLRADASLTSGQFFVDAFYGGWPSREFSTTITVTSAGVAGIDFDLAPGGAIAGQVTDAANGAPLAGIDLDFYDAAGNRLALNARTDAAGDYEIGAIPAGQYKLRADPTIVQGYPRTYYLSQYNQTDAQAVAVSAGARTTGIDFALPRSGVIRGIISETGSGAALGGIDLDCYDSLGRRVDVTARTDAAGFYELGPLAPGTYFLRSDADPRLGQFYVNVYHDGQVSRDVATSISVAGGAATAIDFALAPGGTIAGTVTDAAGGGALADIDVDLFGAAGDRVDLNARTDAAGSFEIGPVPAGSYTLRVDPTLAQGYPRTYYLNRYTPGTAQAISVASGARTAGIDFALPRAGSISGVITAQASGAALSGIDLDCFDALGNRLDLTAQSDTSGTYRFGRLAPGSYFLRADPSPREGSLAEYYVDAVQLGFATPITVAADADAGGVDFVLDPAGWIEGQVANESGAALAEIDLDVYDATTGDT